MIADLLAVMRGDGGEDPAPVPGDPAALPDAAEWLPDNPADLLAVLQARCGGIFSLGADGAPVWRGLDPEAGSPSEAVRARLRAGRAEIVAWLEQRDRALLGRARIASDWTAADWLAFFAERAAIREFDGKISRGDSELLAMGDCVAHWQAINPPAGGGSRDRCFHCGRAGQSDSLLPVIGGSGDAWIHPGCFGAFKAAGERAAIEALRALVPDLEWSRAERVPA